MSQLIQEWEYTQLTTMESMPNRNYQAGRRLEYELKADWIKRGYDVIRASGSHGKYDLVAFTQNHKPEFIQAKRVSNEKAGDRLLTRFRKETQPSIYYFQVMVVKVKGSKTYNSVTV